MRGYDANSLYLHSIMQKNPTDYFCSYQEKEAYCPHPACRYELACYQWLLWQEDCRNIRIQHQFNCGEVRITDCSFPLDGIAGNQAFQFFGCVWHGCDLCWANRNRDGARCSTSISSIFYAQLLSRRTQKEHSANYKEN